jgi:hypothetical protein
VHDPETDHKLNIDLERYSSFQQDRSLTESDMEKWEFTIKEIKRREGVRKMLRVVEWRIRVRMHKDGVTRKDSEKVRVQSLQMLLTENLGTIGCERERGE